MKIVGMVVLVIHIVVGDKNDESINIADDSGYYNFSYKDKTFYTTIYLNNIPAGVTSYTLYYGIDKIIKKEDIASFVISKTINTGISLPLAEESIEIKIKIFKKDNMLCAHKVIARQIPKNGNCNWPCNQCSLYYKCEWTVDFNKMCVVITKAGSTVDFYSDITSEKVKSKDYILHQWLQIDTEKGLFVGALPLTRSKKNRFTINAESFDNNIYVDCRSSTLNANKDTFDSITLLRVIKNDSESDIPVLRYSAPKEYKFHCDKYLTSTSFIQVGMINKKTNEIKIYDRGHFIMNFEMADNGTIISCLLYNIQKDKHHVTHITRQIKNKKLLVYDEFAGDDGIRLIIYIVSGLIGVACIILGIFIICKKCCFKRKTEVSQVTEEMDGTNLENEVELETYYSCPNPVFYADLDMSVAARPNRPTEESPYVNIIGVVSPFNRNNKNDRNN